MYYESGALEAEIHFQNDKREGITKGYYESGALEAETHFQNDKKEGIARVYHENGRLGMEIINKNDKAVRGKCANGRQWTNAEIENWNNGLQVYCSN